MSHLIAIEDLNPDQVDTFTKWEGEVFWIVPECA